MKPTPGPIRDWTKAPNGDLLFVDELRHRVLVEGSDGVLRVAPGDFRYPCSIAVMDSRAYVVDSWNHRVQVFDLPDWSPAFEFGGLFCPSSIAVFNGLLVIADTNNQRLSFHEPGGTPAFAYALDGFPRRVSVNSDDRLVVGYDDGRCETLAC